MRFSFDDFVLDTDAFTLTEGGVEVGVELRVLETLVFLIRERHRVISKEELLESVWDIDFASEATLFKAIQQARKAVGDNGKSQRVIKTIHGKGYRFVAEVEEESGGAPAPVPPGSEAPAEIERVEGRRPPDGSRRKIVVAAVVVVVILAALGWLISRKTPSVDASARTSVAVLQCGGDPGLGPGEAWMHEAVPELLFLRLRSAGGLRMIAADEVVEALRDLGVETGQDAEDLRRREILDRLACDVAITTRLQQTADGGLRLEATILSREAPHSQEISRKDAQGELFTLAGELGAEIAKRLGGHLREAKDHRWSPEVQPEAFARYVEGQRAFRDGDLNEAVSVLAPLVAQYPKFALARIVLAKIYQSMGLKDAAGLEARTALQFAGSLPAETRLQVEALTLEIDGLWVEAARIYRSLWSVAPDEVEYSLALIRALRWAGRSDEALEIGERIGESLEADPRLHLEVSRIHQIQGDSERQRASLEKARATAEERGATGRLASALLGLGWVDLSDGKLPEAEQRFRQAEELFRSIGNQRGEARCFKGRATALSYGPNPEASLPLFEQAAQLQRERGDLEDLGKTLYSVTGLLAFLGDVDGSLASGLEVLEIARKAGDREVEGAVLVKIGDAQVDLGNPVEGMETYLEALPILEDQGATRRLANLYNSMGLACEHSGDMPAAVRHFRHSTEMWQGIGDTGSWFNAAYNLAWLHLRTGDLVEGANLLGSLRAAQADDSEKAAVLHLEAGIAYEQGDFKSAETSVDAAIDLRESTGEGAALESSRALSLQNLLAQGRHEKVLAVVEREIARLREDGDSQALVTALLVEAEALGQAGRWPKALESVGEARTMDQAQVLPQVQAAADIVAGRVNIHLGQFKQAATHLDQARQSAERSGLALLVLEAEIARAEMLMERGEREEALSDLAHLRRQAERRGWGRLAKSTSHF